MRAALRYPLAALVAAVSVVLLLGLLLTSPAARADENTFISTWRTTTDGETITLPLVNGYTYNFTIDWGDGSEIQTVDAYNSANREHVYATAGDHEVRIDGQIGGFRFANGGDKANHIDISQWGSFEMGSQGQQFYGAANLDVSATDSPDMDGASLASAFKGTGLTNVSGMSDWDVSKVTSFVGMFESAGAFTGDLAGWSLGTDESVTDPVDASRMFASAVAFNGSVADWDVSRVKKLDTMFNQADSFDQDLTSWTLPSFDSIPESVDVTINEFLWNADAFNSPILNWDLSRFSSMRRFFMQTPSFNQDLSTWTLPTDPSLDVDYTSMFEEATAFNNDSLAGWDVSRGTNFLAMFKKATAFNGDITSWQLSTDPGDSVSLREMFRGASAFDRDIGGWDVSRVNTLQNTFYEASAFDQDISGWDVSGTFNFTNTFREATSFDQDLGPWDVSHGSFFTNMFNGAQLSPQNYDSLLMGWTTLDLTLGKNISFGSSNYSPAAAEAHAKLTDPVGSGGFQWTITQEGGVVAAAPTAVSAIPGNAAVTVSWTPSDNNGGSEITSYTASAAGTDQSCTTAPEASSCVVTGLSNGSQYTFEVVATTAIGDSPPGTSAAVTPRTVPDAPTAVSGVAGDGQVTVTWEAPASDGGAAITAYTAQAVEGGQTCTSAGDTASCTVTGLSNGTRYSFTVQAENVAGMSAPSAASAAVTPTAPAPTPTTVSPSPTGFPSPTTSPTTSPSSSPTSRWNPPPPELVGVCGPSSCAGADLSGMDLSGLDLAGVDFEGADFAGCSLEEADLEGANLGSADLTGCDLTGADLRGAVLTDADFTGADLGDADLRGASPTGAQLTSAGSGPGMRGTDFSDATLRGTLIGAQDLREVSLTGATLTGTDLRGASIEDSALKAARLKHTQLHGATLTGVTLDRARIKDTSLARARLRQVSLYGAELHDVSFARASVRKLDMRRAHATSVSFSRARLAGLRAARSSIDGLSLAHARRVLRVNLSGSTLTGLAPTPPRSAASRSAALKMDAAVRTLRRLADFGFRVSAASAKPGNG